MSTATLVSLVPFPITEEKPGLIPNRFHIDPSDCVIPSLLHVEDAAHFIYLDEERGSLRVKDDAEQVARSLVYDYTSAQLAVTENAGPGMFWVPGKLKLKDIEEDFAHKIIEASERQKRWFTIICRIADDDFAKYHQHNVISDFQRIAATFLGLNPKEHIWMNLKEEVRVEKVDCFGCGTPVNLNIAVCPVCTCILDEEKYAKLNFAKK